LRQIWGVNLWSREVSIEVIKRLVLKKNAGDRLNQKNLSRRIKIYQKSIFSNQIRLPGPPTRLSATDHHSWSSWLHSNWIRLKEPLCLSGIRAQPNLNGQV
jgi:hypothetical protein